MKKFKSGISVISIEIKNVRPPSPVASAFKDVVNAREERATMIHDAEAYCNQIIPEAKAEAARITNEGEAFKTKRLEHARGETQRFTLLANEYAKAEEITKTRVFIDAMSEIMSKVKKYIVSGEGNNPAADLKFLVREIEKGKQGF